MSETADSAFAGAGALGAHSAAVAEGFHSDALAFIVPCLYLSSMWYGWVRSFA